MKREEAQGGRRLIGIPVWPEQGVISLSSYLFLLFVVILMATYIPLNPIETYGPPAPGTPVMRPDWYFLPVYGFLKLIPGNLTFDVLGEKITPETIGGVFFPAFLFLVLALLPFIDKAEEPGYYIENPLHRPFMTAFGAGCVVFLCMTAAAGYIDVLQIPPAKMAISVGLATLAVWSVTWLLLRRFNNKRGNHDQT